MGVRRHSLLVKLTVQCLISVLLSKFKFDREEHYHLLFLNNEATRLLWRQKSIECADSLRKKRLESNEILKRKTLKVLCNSYVCTIIPKFAPVNR